MDSLDYSKLIPSDGLKAFSDAAKKFSAISENAPKIDIEKIAKTIQDSDSQLNAINAIREAQIDISNYAVPYEPDPMIRQSQEANIETAQNTRDIKEQQSEVVDILKQQLQVSIDQKQELRKIFYSSEDKAKVEKAILEMLEKQGVNVKEITIDKGIDLIISILSYIISIKGLL